MVVAQGGIWWADLPALTGSGPGFQRPAVVVQSDAFNRSNIATSSASRLPKESVANVSQILAIDRDLLTERAGRVSRNQLEAILDGIGKLLGR